MVTKWTSDDLPSLPDVLGDVTTPEQFEGAAAYRTAALAHPNAHHPKPEPDRWRRARSIVEAERDTAREERDKAIRERRQMEDDHAKMCREWRGMDARVVEAERERDEADQRCAVAESERDRWKLHHDRVDGQWAKAEREVTQLRAMERERDEWKARAEQAEEQWEKWEHEAREQANRAEAAEQALTDAWDDPGPNTLLRALTHALLALQEVKP